MRIREGDRQEVAALQDIERAAGRWFRDVGMDEIADDDPPSSGTLRGYADAGGLWVVTEDDEGPPVAYALVEPVDDCLHIEQISVHPDAARRGIGRALIDHIGARAAAEGRPALTLTTFTEVAWNAPYYERLGFRPLAEHELTPGLREIRRTEKEHGLDRWPRVCMRRPTSRPAAV